MSASERFHSLRVAAVHPVADDALELCFDLPQGEDAAAAFHFQPGQHLALRAVVEGVEQRRSYSLCGAQGLAVGVRRVPGGRFSTWLHAHVRPGTVLDVWPPEGRFGAALQHAPRHVLLVAGGSGITPINSLAEAQLAAGRRATLVYANRTLASTMFIDELADLKDRHLGRFTLHTLLSREAVDSPLGEGRLDAGKLAQVLRLAGSMDEVFVCGPAAFNDEVHAALRGLDVPAERIHIERFGVPDDTLASTTTAAPATAAAGAELVVIRDGRQRRIDWPTAQAAGAVNVLAAATAAGMELPYSCRSGVCATCRAKVLEGTVAMQRNFALEAVDVAAGHVLSCQAVPTSERVVVSFDER